MRSGERAGPPHCQPIPVPARDADAACRTPRERPKSTAGSPASIVALQPHSLHLYRRYVKEKRSVGGARETTGGRGDVRRLLEAWGLVWDAACPHRLQGATGFAVRIQRTRPGVHDRRCRPGSVRSQDPAGKQGNHRIVRKPDDSLLRGLDSFTTDELSHPWC